MDMANSSSSNLYSNTPSLSSTPALPHLTSTRLIAPNYNHSLDMSVWRLPL